MDATIAVWTSPELQQERLRARGWSDEHASRRIAAQFTAGRKLELADYGIINTGSMEQLEEQCREIDLNLKKQFKK